MNRADLVATVSAQSGYSKVDVDKILTSVTYTIVSALKDGERVNVRDFGALEIRSRKERNGRNPATGEKLTIPASQYVGFKSSKELKDAVAVVNPVERI